MNRIINLLRVGGRAGVIVPDGVLFGSSNAHKDLRKMLIEECELQGDRLDAGRRVQAVRRREHRGAHLREGRQDRERLVLRHEGGRLLARRQARQDRGQRHPRRDRAVAVARPEEGHRPDRPGRSSSPRRRSRRTTTTSPSTATRRSTTRSSSTTRRRSILARLRALEDEIREDLDELEGMLG